MADGFNNYDYLPGHNVRFRDRNLNLRNDNAPAKTFSVLLIGTATDGPVLQPVRVTPNTASMFGKMTNNNGTANGATLLQKFEEVWQAGCRDVRLMRASGKVSKLSLAGTPFNQTVEDIQNDQLGVGQGNAAKSFTLPNGGVEAASLVVKADGVPLAASAYTLNAGVAADLSQLPDPEVKATLDLLPEVCSMKANITVTYTFAYKDSTGADASGAVNNSNADSLGNPMIADGADKVFNLSRIPKSGLKLYADGAEIMDDTVLTVDAAGKTLTVHNTVKVKKGQLLEARFAFDVSSIVTPSIELESGSGGSLYNDLQGEVTSANGIVTVTLVKPDSKKASVTEAPMIFKSTDYPSFQLMASAINAHPDNKSIIRAKTDYNDTMTSTLQVKPKTYFSGGDDELFLPPDEMYKRLGGERDDEGYIITQGAYQILENYKVDYVIPLGVQADTKLVGKYDDFAYQLAFACAVMSYYNNVTNGLISTSSPKGTTLVDIENHVRKLEASSKLYYMRDRQGNIIRDQDGQPHDIGQYIGIVAGPDVVIGNTRLGAVATQGAAAMGGFMANLAPQSAPTNKILPGALALRYEYSAEQLNRLTKARYITFQYKNNGADVSIVDAMTCAHTGSDFTRMSTANILRDVLNNIREVADPYLGEPNDPAQRNALTASIAKRLDLIQEKKTILSYEFQIIADAQMELMGEAQIELSIEAPKELRKLTTVAGLK